MATNIEIKARVHDFTSLREKAESLSDVPAELIHQEDTFFHSPQGRLKLRHLGPNEGQLIYYERQDASGPKRSDYFISLTAEPDTLKQVLAAGLGIRGVVRKQRRLYWVDHTRIHLDQVEGLGTFMELEVMLQPEQKPEDGARIAAKIMEQLDIDQADLIEGAYIDLLTSHAGS
jgi:predicted adenylyl cyclase CyaB